MPFASWLIVGGSVDFCVGDLEATARPGTLVHVPGGTTHWFRFGGEGGEMISITPRAGASGLFTDIDRQIAPGKPASAHSSRSQPHMA